MLKIKDWIELEEYAKTDPNPNYIIDFSDGRFDGEDETISPHSAWIRPKFDMKDDRYFEHNYYLSTHTFYGKNKDGTGIDSYKESTEILQRFGFDVELDNWDK